MLAIKDTSKKISSISLFPFFFTFCDHSGWSKMIVRRTSTSSEFDEYETTKIFSVSFLDIQKSNRALFPFFPISQNKGETVQRPIQNLLCGGGGVQNSDLVLVPER